MSRNRLMKTSVLSLAATLFIAAIFAASRFVAHTVAAPQAVIVELKSEPVVVAKALAEARGQNFDALTYRQQLVAEQNQFLNQLSADSGLSLPGGARVMQVTVNPLTKSVTTKLL